MGIPFCARKIAAALALTIGLFAQDRLQQDLSFSRNLAVRFAAPGLAQDELARLQQQCDKKADLDQIAVAFVEVALQQARLQSDYILQRTNYRAALTAAIQLSTRADASAQTALHPISATIAAEYESCLLHELRLAPPLNSSQVADRMAELDRALIHGITSSDAALRELGPQTEDSPERCARRNCLALQHGVLLREQACRSPVDQSWLLASAVGVLQDLCRATDPDPVLQKRAEYELALCLEQSKEAGTTDDCTAVADKVAAYIVAKNQRHTTTSAHELKRLHFLLQEITYHIAKTAITMGKPGFAVERINATKELQNATAPLAELDTWEPLHGHLLLLLSAELAAENGDRVRSQSAITLARNIEARHGNDLTALCARNLLRKLLPATDAGTNDDSRLLLAAVDLREQDYDKAIANCHSVLANNPGDLSAATLLAQALHHCDRNLEAVLLLHTVLSQKVSSTKISTVAAADELERAIAACNSTYSCDSMLGPILASILASAHGTAMRFCRMDGDQVAFFAGNEALQNGNPKAALLAFKTIAPGHLHYDLARARMARALIALGDVEGARGALSELQVNFATKPTTVPQDNYATRREADLATAMLQWLLAYGDERLARQKDLAQYAAAITALRNFLGTYGDSDIDRDDELTFAATEALGLLHADRGELALADDACERLHRFAAKRFTRLDAAVFAAFSEHAGNLLFELTESLPAASSTSAIRQLTEDLRRARQRLVTLGMEHCYRVPEPQLSLLLQAAEASLQLDDSAVAVTILTRALVLYEQTSDRTCRQQVDQHLRPLLGDALRRQGLFSQAFAVLLEAERRAPSNVAVKRLICLCLCGECTLDAQGRLVQQTGLSMSKAAADKYQAEYRPFALRREVAPFGLEWYRYHFEAYWFLRQAGRTDQRYRRRANAIFSTAQSTDDFATLKTLGPSGERLYHLFDLLR
ncbi:MAG: hypothetical protein NT107_04440 [Planctomycetota bacterium]|nr:hypothetical protein [Planctomycetota bacterium]